MSYITRVISTMSRFGMRSLNRLFSHFFWFNLSTKLVLFDLRRHREACAYLPKGSLVYCTDYFDVDTSSPLPAAVQYREGYRVRTLCRFQPDRGIRRCTAFHIFDEQIQGST